MYKLIPIEELYAHRFGEDLPIAESKVFASIKEIFNNPNIKDEDSMYWELLGWFVNKIGDAFGWVRSDEDRKKRLGELRVLIESIKKNGYKKELEKSLEIDGFVYGDISVKPREGNYEILDGHHRICIMILMGDKFIEARVCE